MSLIHRPAALRGHIFQAQTAIAAGLLTRKQLRSRAWRRLFRGIYADNKLTDSHALRCRAVAAYLLPPGGVIAGRSAATLLGAGLSQTGDPVEVLIPPDQRLSSILGMKVHRGSLGADDMRRVGRIDLTGPVRTCWDLARWLDLEDAVVLFDRMLASRLVTPDQLTAYSVQRNAERGWRRFARVCELSDGRAESIPESRLRVQLALRGLRAPQVQFNVVTTAGFLGRVDLAWPQLRIAVEYDGAWHVGSAQQMHHDRRRLNRLVSAGWLVLHVTAARMRDDFDGFVAELRAAIRARAGKIPV